MPSGPTESLEGHATFGSAHHHGAGLLQPLETLLDDPHRLAHLVEADPVPGVGVGLGAGHDVEVVGLVSAVRLVLADVGGHTGGAKDRPRDPQGEAVLGREHTDALVALAPDRVVVEDRLVLVDPPGISSRKARIFRSPSSGMSILTPPMRMYAWFMRRPVTVSKMSSRISRSRKPYSITLTAPSSRLPVASQTRWRAMRFISLHSTRITCARGGASMPSSRSTARQ